MERHSDQGTEISRIDIAVICALDVEFRAISAKLTPHPEWSADSGLGFQHLFSREGGGLTVLVVRLPDPGAGNVISGIVASLLITRYDPWFLISFGIAGTLDPEKVKTLDVVYSQAVFYLDLRKETKKGLVLKRTVQRETALPLLKLLRNLKVEGYVVHEATLVTGEAVVKDEKSRLRRIAGSAVGDAEAVDMESFGVFQAAYVDQKLLTRTDRLCLAIKGISDAADQNKSDDPHEEASRNAADFLFGVLNASGLSALREESGIDWRPRPLQPFIRRPPHEVLARINKFGSIVQPVVSPDWDPSGLQAVHMRWSHPRVFYHWRLTGKGLHWVEFKFLCILRRLSDAGYPVECLIADVIRPLPHLRLVEEEIPEARDITRRIVDSMLPAQAQSAATFYSEIVPIEEALSRYAQSVGYSHQVRDMLSRGALGTLPDVPASDSQLNLEFNEWLQYIAWKTRCEGVCIIFHSPGRNIYRLLSWFSGLLPALVPTGEIKIQGEWGKFRSPGRDLYLVPPDYPAIVEWLKATSDQEVLGEFWAHIVAQEGLIQTALIEKRRAWSRTRIAEHLPWGGDPAWIEDFLTREEPTPEYYKGAILLELAWLNKTFFASFRDQPGK